MPCADDLKEEVRSLLAQGKVPELITLCGAPHNVIYVECSLMLRVCRFRSLLTLSPAYLFT